ncbi:MAG: type II toxin-antitoxin system ParD family antitoxin [Tannerella sp.]|nr:type II toxin-antitoxin system ParD family antitoxin [Tannerella sp.]
MSEGRYQNTCKVIHADLRLLEEEENKTMILKNAVSINETRLKFQRFCMAE